VTREPSLAVRPQIKVVPQRIVPSREKPKPIWYCPWMGSLGGGGDGIKYIPDPEPISDRDGDHGGSSGAKDGDGGESDDNSGGGGGWS